MRDGGMFRASPVLLSQLMIVLAKHLAAATQGMIPFTDSAPAHRVAFTPLGPDLSYRYSWQMQIGGFLPIPALDTPLKTVLKFRDAYPEEREKLAREVSKLLVLVPDPADETDPGQARAEIAKTVRTIEKAVKQLNKASRSSDITWVERSLWALGGLGLAGAAASAGPLGWLFTALSGLGIGISTVVTRPSVSTEFAYLQHLQSAFPGAAWRSPAQLRLSGAVPTKYGR